MTFRLWILIAVALPRVAQAKWFSDDLQALPCRPTIACTADIVPPGAVEIEMGYLFRRLKDPVLQHSVPILSKLTLADWVQLQIGGNGPTWSNGSGVVDDVVMGLKFHLADQTRRRPSISWSIEASLPIGTEPGFVRSYDLLWAVYLTKDFGWLHADLNLGLNLWRLDGATKPQPWVALALSVALPRKFTVMAEGYYYFDANPYASDDGGLLLAVAYTARPWLVFDTGVDIGFIQSQRWVSAFVGLTFAPADFWKSPSEMRKLPGQR